MLTLTKKIKKGFHVLEKKWILFQHFLTHKSMRIFLLKSIVVCLAICTLFTMCKTSKSTASKYVGEWHYTFEMEGTEYAAYMTINSVEDGYTGSLTSDMGSVDLDDLVIEEDKLTASFDIQGYVMDLKGTFDGEAFHGSTSIDGYEFPMEAVRQQ